MLKFFTHSRDLQNSRMEKDTCNTADSNSINACDDPEMADNHTCDPTGLREATGYMPIENYGLIGNMRTAALVATDGGLDYLCWPDFDSPSIFCRILDREKGGHWTISPPNHVKLTTKQQYLPSSNILQTTFYGDEGVVKLGDFFPRPSKVEPVELNRPHLPRKKDANEGRSRSLKKWLVRRVECIRGEMRINVVIAPAFNYGRNCHRIETIPVSQRASDEAADEVAEQVFISSKTQRVVFGAAAGSDGNGVEAPKVRFEVFGEDGNRPSVQVRLHLKDGQRASFTMRNADGILGAPQEIEHITLPLLDRLQEKTKQFWFEWISQSTYHGRWQEIVQRSLLTLKLLTYEPTGAIVAAPTFSLPEAVGGTRNWDYRYSWVRDSSFTVYILLRMGFKQEAEAYMTFIMDRLKHNKTIEGGLPIMFSIHGGTDLPEIELDHLEGYRGSRPVRIGNGAAFHKQLDIYGELMDAIYLYNKYGKPVSYSDWLAVRDLTDFVCSVWQEKDMSIWEVRGEIQNFTYSKIMLWVAIDRALRLADKRCFPCPKRLEWLATRDAIMESVMQHGYNEKLKCFIQSYEHRDALDSAVLIAPLVFFVAPNDPRFTNTLQRILQPPERGGLTSAGMVYRYNTLLSDDGKYFTFIHYRQRTNRASGVGGDEGVFSMCTFWLVEALTRAGAYERKYLEQAVALFENTLGFGNHLSMFSEEISKSGEQLGNTPQAFSHLALISAAFNLDRVTKGQWKLGQ